MALASAQPLAIEASPSAPTPTRPYLPPELLYQIAMLTPLATLSAFRRTSKQLLALLPSGDELLHREYTALLNHYTIHEALARAVFRAVHFRGCVNELGQTAHMRLVRMLVITAGASWGKAFGGCDVWKSPPIPGRIYTPQRRDTMTSMQALVRMTCGPENADELLAEHGLPPCNPTDYCIWRWEVQMRIMKKWCRMFGEAHDVPAIKSFLPVLGLFEVAQIAPCAELDDEAQKSWMDWRL
ncbi:hypothetical protein HDU87_003885 [Geranomyces variabilis]|uniref:F-box domain-containing protein n=1 Tax=Geranomyces variabilis TaxID=109894 RepID=A0AAD5TQR3_9FUNG|nr:hypothetical protein HDU87_003885 [Geranomyces variabilis]